MNQLREAYEQMTKMNAEIFDHWRKLMSEAPWLGFTQSSASESVNPWLEAVRTGYQASLTSWNWMLDQGQEVFFRSLKEARSYRQAMEKQMRENWEELRSAQESQQQKTKEFFANLASFLKEETEQRPS